MKLINTASIFILYSVALISQIFQKDWRMLYVALIIILILTLFSYATGHFAHTGSRIRKELGTRTQTWWWLCGIFLMTTSTHPVISFDILAIICFLLLREFYSLMPMTETYESKTLSFKDQLSMVISYLAIPIVLYLAYIQWYFLFIVFVPVYLFLLIPIIFVLQNRVEGAIKSLGILSLGFMFFVFNFGHCLFMINISPILLAYCFVITESRDLLAFVIGRNFERIANTHPSLKPLLITPIALQISQNKTWTTGLITALGAAGLSLLFVPLMPPFALGQFSYTFAAILGFIIGIVGLFGDMVFTMIKRDLGITKSGNTLPGIGGMIDRIDSLVYTIPIVFHLIYWWYF